jgi:hypothetical protein
MMRSLTADVRFSAPGVCPRPGLPCWASRFPALFQEWSSIALPGQFLAGILAITDLCESQYQAFGH